MPLLATLQALPVVKLISKTPVIHTLSDALHAGRQGPQALLRWGQSKLPHSVGDWALLIKTLSYLPAALLAPVITHFTLRHAGLSAKETKPFVHQEEERQIWGAFMGLCSFGAGAAFCAAVFKSSTRIHQVLFGVLVETLGYSARAWHLNQRLGKELMSQKNPPSPRLNMRSNAPAFAAVEPLTNRVTSLTPKPFNKAVFTEASLFTSPLPTLPLA